MNKKINFRHLRQKLRVHLVSTFYLLVVRTSISSIYFISLSFSLSLSLSLSLSHSLFLSESVIKLVFTWQFFRNEKLIFFPKIKMTCTLATTLNMERSTFRVKALLGYGAMKKYLVVFPCILILVPILVKSCRKKSVKDRVI